jgi:DNA-binding GntR family transcriptional regulator
MKTKGIIISNSLKDQVYDYLRDQMGKGKLLPGSLVNLDATSRKLGISKTPLRDALLRLELEGFVTILPRKGVYVKEVTLEDIRDAYQIIGALESTALLSAAGMIEDSHGKEMEELIQGMRSAIEKDDFKTYYALNLDFHDSYIQLCGNDTLIRIIDNHRKRLYDFPFREGYVKAWEEASILEHRQILDLIREERFQEAARYIVEVHWSYSVQEKFIRQYYPQQPAKGKAEA